MSDKKHVSNVIISAPKNTIILVTDPKNDKQTWRIPGGIMKEEETPIQTAIREIEENTGLIIIEEKLEFVKKIDLRKYNRFLYRTRVSSLINLKSTCSNGANVGIFPIANIPKMGNLSQLHKTMLLNINLME